MRSRRWRLVVPTSVTVVVLVLSATGAGAAGNRPTPTQLDKGLLTTADLLSTFEETDRRPLDAATLAADDRGPCNGPNTMAHAVALDPDVDVVTASFGTDAGASLTEDVFSFANAKQAAAFISRNAKQQQGCDTWNGVLQGASRRFEVQSVRTPKLAGQPAQLNVTIAPTSATAKGFDGPLIRQTTYVRDGSVVASLLYLRSVDFPATTPGPGYPKSAVKRLEAAL